MLVLFLALKTFISNVTMKKGDMKLLQLEMKPEETFSIRCHGGFLGIVFFRRTNLDINITINNNFFHQMTEDKKACGFDFGENNVDIEIVAHDFGELFASLIAWPSECRKHRVITTLPFDTMVYSWHSPDADFQLRDSQKICIWTAQPTMQEMHVQMHSEGGFDVLEYRSHRGIHKAFSGNESGEVHSTKGLNYFVWRSDDQHTSDNFTINIRSKVRPILPFFKKTIRWPGEVIALFPWDGENGDFYPGGQEPEWTPVSETRKIMPVFYTLTAVFVIATAVVVGWCVSVAMEEDDVSEDADTRGAIEGEYVHATGDTMPQPILIQNRATEL